MRVRGLQITGPFSDEELHEVLAKLREIESRHPHEVYEFLLLGADTMDDAEEALSRLFPNVPAWQRVRKQ